MRPARSLPLSALTGHAPALLLAGLLVALFWPVLFGGRVFYHRDIHLQWQPNMEAVVSAVGAGSWPLWNPSAGFGQPLLANPNNQLLYPSTWLNLVLRPWTVYTVMVVGHFALAGAGLYRLALRCGVSRPGAFLAAAVWIAGGPFLSLVDLWNHLCGAAWIPWSALAALQLAASARLRDAALWGATVAAPVLAGSPETAVMAATAGACLALPSVRGAFTEGRGTRVLLLAAGAALFAVLLAAAQWVPSLELARRSVRTDLPEALRSFWSVHPATLLELFVPTFLHTLPLHWELRGRLYDFREPFLVSTYLGLGTVGFVAAALAGPRQRHRVALVALVVFCGLLALGRHGGLYDLAVQLVPPLRSLRYPAKLLVLVGFAWALLAGLGFDRWRADEPRRMRVVAAAALLATALGALGLALLALRGAEQWGSALLFRGENPASFTEILAPVGRRAGQAALCALGVLALSTGLARRRLRADLLAACAIGLVLVDLVATHARLHPTVTRDLFLYRPPAVEAARPAPGQRVFSYDYFEQGKSLQHLGHRSSYLAVLPQHKWPFPGFEALALRSTLYSSVLGVWGLEAGYPTDALGLFPKQLSALTTLVYRAEGRPEFLRLLQVGAVGTVAALHTAGFQELSPLQSFPTLMVEPLHVFRVPDPLPRAFAVDQARLADAPDELAVLIEAGFDPRREIVLARRDAAGALPRAPRTVPFAASVHETARLPDRIRLEADLSAPGYVVLLDGYDPNWRVTVDGRDAQVLRANVAFRAVAVPAGRHVIEYRYRPTSVWIGLGLSGIALLAAGLVWRRGP